MLPKNTVAALIAVFLQAHPTMFRLFFRYRFGRRYFTFREGVFVPFLFLSLAMLARAWLPQAVTYAPLRLIPPWNAEAGYQPLFESGTGGLAAADGAFFGNFAGLVMLLALLHFLYLRFSCWRKTDPTNTRFWGISWLEHVPLLGRLRPSLLHGAIEPGIVVALGYCACAWAPAFGIFAMAGGIGLGIENARGWRQARDAEFDARDSLVSADAARAAHEKAVEHDEELERRRSATTISESTLARIETNPKALLMFSEGETAAVKEALGGERFLELCDDLEPEDQDTVYAKARHGADLRLVPPKAESA